MKTRRSWIGPGIVVLLTAILAAVSTQGLDTTLSHWIEARHPDLYDPWLVSFNELGKPLALSWCLFFFVWGTGHRRTLLAGALAAGICSLGVLAVKRAVQRVRPDEIVKAHQKPTGEATSYAFPSGHTALAFAVATVVSGAGRGLSPAPYLLACGPPCARLALDRHYLSDVLAGGIVGYLSGLLGLTLAARFRLPRTRRLRFLAGLAVLGISLAQIPAPGPLYDRFLPILGPYLAALMLAAKGRCWLRWCRQRPAAPGAGPALVLLAVLAVGSVLGFIRYSNREAYYVEAAHEMIRSTFLVPRYNWVPRTDEPPLAITLMAMAMQVLRVREAPARIASVLCAAFSMWLTFGIGRSMWSTDVGLMAALMLGTSAVFCAAGHLATPDMVWVAAVTATMAAGWTLVRTAGQRGYLVLGAAAALVVLAGGTGGLAVPLLTLLAVFVAGRQWRLLPRLALSAVVAAVLILVWVVAVRRAERVDILPGLLTSGIENVTIWVGMRRVAGGAVTLLSTFLPWAIFAGWALRRLRGSGPAPATAYLAAWILLPLVPMSLTARPYVALLTLLPPLALLTARGLLRPATAVPPNLAVLTLPLALGGAVALAIVAMPTIVHCPGVQWAFAPAAVLAALAGVAVTRALMRRDVPGAAIATATGALLVHTVLWQVSFVALEPFRSDRPVTEALTHYVGERFNEARYAFVDCPDRVTRKYMAFRALNTVWINRSQLMEFLRPPGLVLAVVAGPDFDAPPGFQVLCQNTYWVAAEWDWVRLTVIARSR